MYLIIKTKDEKKQRSAKYLQAQFERNLRALATNGASDRNGLAAQPEKPKVLQIKKSN
jgi:hypothetical protein